MEDVFHLLQFFSVQIKPYSELVVRHSFSFREILRKQIIC